MNAATPGPEGGTTFSQQEFQDFIVALTHAVRNRLNALALEATDLSEQAEGKLDASRLHKQIQECAVMLRDLRNALAPEDLAQPPRSLPELTRQLRERP